TNTPLVSLAPYPEIGAPIDPTESRLSSPRLVDTVEREAARLVPHDIARSLGFVITAADRGHGIVAMTDPLDDTAFGEAERRSKLRLTRVTGTQDDINDALDRVWRGADHHVIFTGSVLSKLYATTVLGAIVAALVIGFGLVVRDALAPRFAFSLFALFCGLIFFLYALKYYATIASVLLITLFGDHPRVRVIHRTSRKGFKGGALQEALRRMNARTEYVMVFDADFVPPADAIWHFLDYFGRLSKSKNDNGHNGNGHANTPGAP